jgi:catechol 2,3-dioxygenase-like lactoylglutathione lyase family enzyme
MSRRALSGSVRRHLGKIVQDRGMGHRVTGIDHVQLAMPSGRELEAEAFYAGVLGLEVLEKPPLLAARGGRWFTAAGGTGTGTAGTGGTGTAGTGGTGVGVQVHLGVEEGFRPARKAHPGLCVAGFDDLLAALRERGIPWRTDGDLPGVRRIYVDDPFGNRLELIDAGPVGGGREG